MIKNYFKTAFRSLWLHKLNSLINICGLSVSLAAVVLIMVWIQNEESFDSYNADFSNIYRITSKLEISKNETMIWETSPYLLGDLSKRELPEVVDVAHLEPIGLNKQIFRYKDQLTSEKKCAFIDDQWFKFFHYDVVAGTVENFNKYPKSLILTSTAAKRYFHGEDAVGKVIVIDSTGYEVRAIVKDNPVNSSFQYDVLIPISSKFSNPKERSSTLDWGNFNCLTFLKFETNVKTDIVSNKITQILHNNRKGDQTDISLVKLQDIHFESNIVDSSVIHGNKNLLKVFVVLGALVLITACINYVNLTTAKASVRSKEVSIRKIIGAGRSDLLLQFLIESFIISCISLLLAIGLIELSLPWFNSLTEKQFPSPIFLLSTWIILGGTLLGSFMVNGIYPAVLLSSFQPLNVFRGKTFLNIKNTSLRKALVVLQFIITVALIICTSIIYLQLKYTEKADLGYDKSNILVLSVPRAALATDLEKNKLLLQSIKSELMQQSSIVDVSLTSSNAIYNNSGSASGSLDWIGRPKNFNPNVATLSADENFKKLMNLRISEGRWFSANKSDLHNIILNETAVREFNLPMPVVGQRFISDSDTGVIVGVVKDFHYKNFHEKIGSMVINSHVDYSPTFYIKITPGSVSSVIEAANKIWNNFIPNQPFEYSFVEEGYNNLYQSEQRSFSLLTMFAIIGISISMLGLFGLVTLAIEQRIKEVGIRKIIGASPLSVVSLLSFDYLKMVIIACLIAFPLSWWSMNKWLNNFAYHISISIWVFFFAGLFVLIISLFTVSFKTIKAAISNPIKSLRSE